MAQANESIQIIPKDFLNLIPKYDGDHGILNFFIRKCEYIIRNFNGPSNAVQSTYVFHCITSRLCGRAASLLSEREDITSWAQLKSLFIQHFGDPRSEECVAIELENLKIKLGETFLEFCVRIQQMRSALCSKVNLLADENVKNAKMIIYNNMCLNVFLYNLPEDLIRIVRLKNCTSLESALSVVMEEVNFQAQYNAKNKNKTNTLKPPQHFGNNEAFKSQLALRPNFSPNNFGFSGNINSRPANFQTQNNFRHGFKFGIPNQSFSKPPNNFKFGIPQQGQFRPPFNNNSSFRPNPQFKFGMPPSNQQFKFGIPPPNQQFKFGLPPQGQPRRNPPNFQETDISMRTARPVQQNMITHLPDTEGNNLFYSYDGNNFDYMGFQGQEYLPDYDSNHEQNVYFTDESGQTNYDNFYVENTKPTVCETENFHTPASNTEIIELNYNGINKLPHIFLPEINAHLLIDTGSTRSFISPTKANQFFSHFKFHEPFEVVSTHARSMHDEVIFIPLPRTFKSIIKHKFYVYNVDGHSDGLIGSDLLKTLDATIDMKNQILRTKNTEIPIVYSPSFEVTLEPRTETRIKVPTDLRNGEAIINFKDFSNGVHMPLSRIKLNVLTNKNDYISMQANVSETESCDSPLVISDSSEATEYHESVYPIRTPSSSTITACSSRETIHSAEDIDTDGIPILDEAIDTKPNQILVFTWNRNQTLVKDLSRDKQRVLEVHLPIDNPELVKKFLLEYIKPKVKYFIYFEDQNHRSQFIDAVIKLFKKDTVQFYECTKRVIYVEDENEQRAIILKYHNGITSHRGIKETLMKLKRNYFWKNMDLIVASVINSCETCKTQKYDRKPLTPKLQLTQTQTRPFNEIFIDLFSVEKKYFLTIIDAFSKLGQAFEISNRSTPEVIRALIKLFSFYGVPKRISADPGSEFNNILLKETLQFYKVELHIGTPHNPNSMGLIERFHSTILEIYRIAKYEHKITDAASAMTYAVMSYNQTIHSATGLTPFEVVFGHTDSSSTFAVDFNRQYTQQLVSDHVKRTKYLYKYLTDKLIVNKEKVVEKRGGDTSFDIKEGDTIFIKGVNTRRSKDKPRFQKAQVSGEIDKNTCPVKFKNRETKVPIKDIKRPSQVHRARSDDNPDPRPSTSKD